MKKSKMLSLVCFSVILMSCHKSNQLEVAKINFSDVQWYADRASAAYQTEQEIRRAFPATVRVTTVANTNVQYFLEIPEGQNKQILSVRGTDNLANIREDAEYLQSKNNKLGIFVHKGFDEDTFKIYQDVLPFLDKEKEVILTGHSLGAAISSLLMIYLHKDGFNIGRSLNFGQPKVTNTDGAKKYQFLPLLRLIDENDVVPLLPPTSFFDSIHGVYSHFGSEVILLEGLFYVYQDTHMQLETHSGSFWENIGEVSVGAHYMKHYLHNINSKLEKAKQIPFAERARYIDK